MLVRFLSYAASVIGARKYKPIFLSLAAVICTVTGISIVATALNKGPHNASSVQGTAQSSDTHSTSSSAELHELNKQQAQGISEQTSVEGQTPTQTVPDDQPKPANPSSKDESAVLDITLRTSTLKVASGSTQNVTLTATTTDNSMATWSITNDTSTSGITASIDPPKENATAHVRLKIDSSVAAGNYQLTLIAKDEVRNLTATKTITLTVNE